MFIERLLRKWLRHKELGWYEIGERFTRYSLLKTKWFNVYLHQLYAPNWAPHCHNHPWSFWTILLWNGYTEMQYEAVYQRPPGWVMYRPAEHSHNVITPYGISWSLIVTGPKKRDWGYDFCTEVETHGVV